MNQMEFIFWIFIFSSFLSRNMVRAVQMAKLLEDGFLNQVKPIGKAIEYPKDYNGTELTVCFWLQPYRFLHSNNILSFSPSTSDVSTMSFSLQEGSFIVKLPNCLLSLDIEPQIREWNHYCFSESEDVNIFIGGTLNSTHDCGLDKLFLKKQDSIFFTIGWDSQITNPVSGLVADAKLFWRKLSHEEVKNVSMASSEPSGIDLLVNLTTDEMSYAEITEIREEELLEEYTPYILLYISEKNTYHRATRVCEVRQGMLPSFQVHGRDTLTKLMSKFSSNSGMSFGSFWISSTNVSTCSIGTFTMRPLDIEVSNEQCNNPRINYFCVVDKKVQYRLIGFNDDDDVIFHPVPYKIGVFESVDVYRLYMKNGQFILKDVTSNFQYLISESRDSDQLLGRYNWYKPDSNEFKKEMTFSGCTFNNFTCSDGLCIDLTAVCQFQRDCDDYSDEAVSLCEVGIPPGTFYDKRLPPSSLSNYTTNISIEFQLLRVLDISKDDSTLNFLVSCVLKWQDERLEFKFLSNNESISVRNDIADKFWQPEIVVNGAIHDDLSKLSFKDNPGDVKVKMLESGVLKVINSYRATFYEGKQVLIISENSVPVTIVCEMDLFFFPFDEQACSFSIELVNDILSDIKWEKGASNITMGPEVFHALYEIFDFEYTFINDKEIQISIKLARNYGAFIFNTIFPCIIIVLIGILSHFLPPHDYNDRVTTAMSCLIVIATLFSQISNSLPESAEPKLIDIWMFAHVLALMHVYVNHTIVLRLDAAETRGENDRRLDNGRLIKGYIAKDDTQKGKNNGDGEILTSVKIAWDKIKTWEKLKLSNMTFQVEKTNRYLFFSSCIVYGIFLLFFSLSAGQYY